MIRISSEARGAITRKLQQRFDMNAEDAEVLIGDVISALARDDRTLFFKVKYYIYRNDSVAVSDRIFKTLYEIHTILISDPENDVHIREIEGKVLRFVLGLHRDQFSQIQRIERHNETVQRIKRQTSDQLNEMLDTQKLMIANISHEMRTSLNAVTGYITQVIGSGAVQGEEQAYLEKANRASESLRSLVTDILDISKINAGEMEIREDYFWLDEVLLHCIDLVIETANNKGLAFEVSTDFFPMRLLGDAQRIIGILVNLLGNAVKFTDRGRVRLEVRKVEEYRDAVKLHFRVCDTGIGMEPQQVATIFEPYSRFAKERQGIGLGMLISKKLAQRMGGELRVESTPGEGTAFDFTVRLPLERGAMAKMQGMLICFFNDMKDESIARLFDQKMRFLQRCGAETVLFSKEMEFTKFLLNEYEKAPDIITIASYREAFDKYDALIHYLKVKPKFAKTTFIAEQTGERQAMSYFDKSFERFSTISAYTNVTAAPSRHISADASEMLQKIRILAVDDIATNLEVLKLFISNKYPQVVLDMAMGGYEAIGMYKTVSYDLIFLDLKMPGLNGFSVLEKFRSIKRPPETYALTADIYKGTYEKVMEAGFAGLLEKPLQPDRLFALLDHLFSPKQTD